MIIEFGFEYIYEKLNLISQVVSDNNLTEDTKTVVLRANKSDTTCTLYGVNTQITYSEILNQDDYTLSFTHIDFDEEFLQINCKMLLSFLATFRNNVATKPLQVQLKVDKNTATVEVVVTEQYKLDTSQVYISSFKLDILPLRSSVLQRINLNLQTEFKIKAEKILHYFKLLFPLLKHDNTFYSYLSFDSKYVVATYSTFVSLMKNTLADTEIFSDIRLHYKGIQFLLKFLVGKEDVFISKDDSQIFIRYENLIVSIAYDTKLISSDNYIGLMSLKRDQFDFKFSVDAQLLQAIIKRFVFVKDTLKIEFDTSTCKLRLTNQNYTFDLPFLPLNDISLLGIQGFKLGADTLQSAIVDVRDNYAIIQIRKIEDNIVTLTISNNTDWWSLIKVLSY